MSAYWGINPHHTVLLLTLGASLAGFALTVGLLAQLVQRMNILGEEFDKKHS